MKCSGPLRIRLPNDTVAGLNIDYEPFHWPHSGHFPDSGGFAIAEPWEGFKSKEWYAEARKPYDDLQRLLQPHNQQWIEANCIAALVPDFDSQNFALVINGVEISESLEESDRLRKLMRSRRMGILVTTCVAKISGGGELTDGRKRGYGIGFDIAALQEIDADKRQRAYEKRQLFKQFVLPVIAEEAKRKFFRHFDGRCFKCGSSRSLEIDHHIPLAHGGHLVPGNLVALCSVCNNRKRETLPQEFYTKEELIRLAPLLHSQEEIFSFSFDWERWSHDRKNYLLSLGIDASLVNEVLNNPNHRLFIPYA